MKKSIYPAAMALALLLSACTEPDEAATATLVIEHEIPQIIEDDFEVISGTLSFEELNTGMKFSFTAPFGDTIALPIGVYNGSGEMELRSHDSIYHVRTSFFQYTLTTSSASSTTSSALPLSWILYNPDNTLVFGEIYFTGSLNAKGTGGLYDSFFTIYNNTDEVQYADGLAIVESKMLNSWSDIILTPENQRDANFTAQAIYVIPGAGTDVPIQPGCSIKIVDQAIDWTEQVPNALNHTDADFEWYDESTKQSVVDTDNPDVPNLDKWFCYTLTIWLPSQQCNRSYALVRFPEGMTMERFLVEQKGEYDYINASTGIQMHAQNCFLIKHDWIIDGVNLCPTEKFIEPVLPSAIDCSYAAISDKNSDINRYGKKFARKQSGTSAGGNILLQDTNNSAVDFEIVSAR